jgi:Kef-type K+ transport system membrane component KefB
MARILKDRGETQTRIGRLSLAGPAVADVFSWVMLAIVVVQAGSGSDRSRIIRMLAGAAPLCKRPTPGRCAARGTLDWHFC